MDPKTVVYPRTPLAFLCRSDSLLERYQSFSELSVPSSPLWVQMSRSGKLLVASFRSRDTDKSDLPIRLWNLETQKLIATYEGCTEDTWALDISPDDKFVVSGSYDSTVRVWLIGSEDTKPLAYHKTAAMVAFLNIHHSFNATAISLWNGKTRLMDVVKGTVIATLDHPDQRDTPWTLRFSSDSQRLYGGQNQEGICYWEEGVLAITASTSWVVFISRLGNLSAINLKSSSKSPEAIGTVNTVPD
ncbi:hypothetical protein FRB99_003297, partial [Tulasnella sp. 403]